MYSIKISIPKDYSIVNLYDEGWAIWKGWDVGYYIRKGFSSKLDAAKYLVDSGIATLDDTCS